MSVEMEFGFVGDVFRCQSTNTKEPKTSDNASNLFTNLLSGGSLGSMPTAEGAVSDLFGKPLFLLLYDWFMEHGGVYKLAFGPKAFVVISDPIVASHVLRENAFSYSKSPSWGTWWETGDPGWELIPRSASGDKSSDGSVSIRSETSIRYVPSTSREAQLRGE
ncbi:hypothetical protein F2Q69_00010295 [Brassica cretica]|uniref:Cytochrome P450 n=1 Tax=Brassica cretica TaxID=69181 RepID=A0A8S9QYP3_BRACR|nr:hypothetical protein F2Q69_00010295 [Brassica cretica]